jgi:predicted RNase H-like HicB family nuclease
VQSGKVEEGKVKNPARQTRVWGTPLSGVSLAGRILLTIMADQEIIFTVEDAPEGGYTARALGYAIFTQGETLEELRRMVRDAVNCHFEKENKPKLIRLHMVKDEVIVA